MSVVSADTAHVCRARMQTVLSGVLVRTFLGAIKGFDLALNGLVRANGSSTAHAHTQFLYP